MRSVEETVKDSLKLIESMVEEGSTDEEIAKKIGISYSSFKRHKSQNSELKAIIAQCKDKKNDMVEQSLFKCCNGYIYHEEVATKVKEEVLDKDTNIILVKEDVKVVKVKKYKGADLAAQKYWLNNKKKATWKEDPHKVENDKKLTKLKEKEVESKVIKLD